MVIVVTGSNRTATSPLATALADRLHWALIDGAQHADAGQEPRRRESPGEAAVRRSSQMQRLRDACLSAAERRQSMVTTSPQLSLAEYLQLTDGLREVRIVSLETAGSDGSVAGAGAATGDRHAGSVERDGVAHSEDGFAHVALDSTADLDALVGHVRLAFGV